MMYVRRIKQRNEYIYVEQSDHWRLGFVIPQTIYCLRCDQPGMSPWRQKRHAIALARGALARRQGTTREVRQHAPGSSPTLSGKLLSRLQHIFIDVQSGSHARSSRIKHKM